MQLIKTTAKVAAKAVKAMKAAEEAEAIAAAAKLAKEARAAEAAKRGAQAAHRASEMSRGAQGVAKAVEKRGVLPKDVIPLDRRAGRRVEEAEKKLLEMRRKKGDDPGEFLEKAAKRETRGK